MTFGTSRSVAGGKPERYSRAVRSLPGALIRYDIATNHFEEGDQLPMRWTVTDLKTGTVRHLAVVSITVGGPRKNTFQRWVPALTHGHKYEVSLKMWRPGGQATDNPAVERDIRFVQTLRRQPDKGASG
jgi:hypothetical protein